MLEPMLLLLLATSIIYFALGERTEAYFMAGAIVLVSTIGIYQDSRSRRALDALRAFSEAQATVIRNNAVLKVQVEDVVVGDLVVAEEGSLLAADGVIVQSNDFSVNESILTGEAFAVARSMDDPELAKVSKGTQVVSGLAVYRFSAVGKAHSRHDQRVIERSKCRRHRFTADHAVRSQLALSALWCSSPYGSWLIRAADHYWIACSPDSPWQCPFCRKRSCCICYVLALVPWRWPNKVLS